jgi:hypothetical protein
MPDYGIFVGFGAAVRGREAKSLELFNEAMQYYARLEEGGTIDSFEAVLLEPHGGDLGGFFLLRGDRDKLSHLRQETEFQRITVRASLIVEGLGVIGATLGDSMGEAMGLFQEAIGELT